jgi:hypothetical protein
MLADQFQHRDQSTVQFHFLAATIALAGKFRNAKVLAEPDIAVIIIS